jgi:hypothetical protein
MTATVTTTPAPTSQAEITEGFTKLLTRMAEDNQKRADAVTDGGTLRWMHAEEWEGDTRNIAALSTGLDRDTINEQYQKVHADAAAPGMVGDAIVLKIQGDYLGMAARAFRWRQSSAIRDIAHATVRHKGHAHAQGVFKGGVLGATQDILKAAKSKA